MWFVLSIYSQYVCCCVPRAYVVDVCGLAAFSFSGGRGGGLVLRRRRHFGFGFCLPNKRFRAT